MSSITLKKNKSYNSKNVSELSEPHLFMNLLGSHIDEDLKNIVT